MAASEEATGEKLENKFKLKMEETFLCQGKQFNVSLKADGLQWTSIAKGKSR